MGAQARGRPCPCTPGPLGEGLRLGLGGETPPRSQPCPPSAARFLWHPRTRHTGFWKLGGLIRALILATGWACSHMTGGGGGVAEQARRPSCAGPGHDSARALRVPAPGVAPRAVRAVLPPIPGTLWAAQGPRGCQGQRGLAGTGDLRLLAVGLPAGSRQKPCGYWGQLRDPGVRTQDLGSGPAQSPKPGRRTALVAWAMEAHRMRVCA